MKTIKHTEALDLIIGKKGTTNREDFEWDIAKDKIEQYANQRVIEELEKLLENESNEWVDDEDGNEECGVRIVYSIRLRDRIKELKQ
jgi:hypothetical protein